MQHEDWFTDWFNTPYYHILYKHRDDADAQIFMKNLVCFLKLSKDSHILDLPCGKGRHAVYLNSLGYKVTGGDLSEKSIAYAKQFENDRLHFNIHDMRASFSQKYDAVFNLFTSFGYFESDKDDLLILKNIKNGLQKEGVFVFDFINVHKLKYSLVENETKKIDGITFDIERKIENKFIFKHIKFNAEGKFYHFTEKVKFLTLKDMQSYFELAGFYIQHTFGDYHLNDYNQEHSERLILIAK